MKNPTAADFMKAELEENDNDECTSVEEVAPCHDYEYACNHCECEMEDDMTWHWKGEEYYCADCASILFDQPKPLTAYEIMLKESQEKERQLQAHLEQERLKVPESERRRIREEREERERRYQKEHEEEMEERQRERESREVERRNTHSTLSNILAMEESKRIQKRTRELEMEHDIESTRLTCEYTGPEEHDPNYDYDSLIQEEDREEFVHTRCYDWDPKTGFETLSREYYHEQEQEEEEDLFPKDHMLHNDWMLHEDQMLHEDPLPNSVEELYEYLDEQLTSQEVSIVPEDAVKLDEEFIYCDTYDEAKEVLEQVTCEQDDMTQLLPDDSYIISQHRGRFWYVLRPVEGNPTKFSISVFASKDEVATKYLIRQLEECIYRIDYLFCPEDYREVSYYGSDAEAHGQEVYPDNWGQIQDSCFVCRKVDYLRLMNAFRGQRVVCDKCYPTVKQCVECDTITQDTTYFDPDSHCRLCFDCRFKTKERVQMPIEEHLMIRRDIQHLRPQHFDVLVDYAALAEFTIFDAYRYKSKCHFYDCIQRMSPSGWCADETLSFCCRRHREYSDESGCHCTNVWNGTDYDDHYEEATCKICNSPHKANVDSRNALMASGEGNNPIVSAIRVFEELSMSNILFDSLVDLREYFV